MEFKLQHSLTSLNNIEIKTHNPFVSSPFLSVFVKHHKENIKHCFISIKDQSSQGMIYAQILTIRGRQIKNYNKKNAVKKQLISLFLNFFNFKIIGFGNNFLTNEASVFINGKMNDPSAFLNQLIHFLSKNNCYNKFIFPDHFFDALAIENPQKTYPQLIRLEVEEDMSITIDPNWKSFEGYQKALKKKYKKRVKSVFTKSQKLNFRKFSEQDLKTYRKKIQQLFNNVRESSSFHSLNFNTNSFIDFYKLKEPKSTVYGYFIEKELVAFSSEWETNNKLYSYFIGLEYGLNKKYHIYDRILYQTIKNGIEKGVNKIIFGRTAGEFKSNVGAVPKKSYLYIYIKNPVLRFILKPILSIITPKKWVQRNPFK